MTSKVPTKSSRSELAGSDNAANQDRGPGQDRDLGSQSQTPCGIFLGQLEANAKSVTAQLEIIFNRYSQNYPETLAFAMDYALMGGGKRFRPFLTLEVAKLLNVPLDRAMMTACAIEVLHCYSLVHDDLPAMDNDELRRGKPTLWKVTDEATTILAGDALQCLAFELLADSVTHPSSETRLNLIKGLAFAAGAGGMAGGQMLDLTAEQAGQTEHFSLSQIEDIHLRKTGQLIQFAAIAPCILANGILANAPDEQCRAIKIYSHALGLAFQLSDDLLDVEGTEAEIGKTPGKDAQSNKATYVTVMGIREARRYLLQLEEEAIASLKPFGDKAKTLIAAAKFLTMRRQ